MNLVVIASQQNPAQGVLRWDGVNHPCALGRGGVSQDKQEGDGATPAGCFALRKLYYRPDVVAKPQTRLATQALTQQDGWADDPQDPAYNRAIVRPHAFSHERLWRDDGLYDIFIVLGINDDPPVAGRGSALFLHLAHPDLRPTRGCVAIAREAMETIVPALLPTTMIEIKDAVQK